MQRRVVWRRLDKFLLSRMFIGTPAASLAVRGFTPAAACGRSRQLLAKTGAATETAAAAAAATAAAA